jgi:lysyl-tRNA synthetase class 2
MLEAYQAFGDYESMMELVQSMICHVAQKVLGTLKISYERASDVRFQIESAKTALLKLRELEIPEPELLRNPLTSLIDATLTQLTECNDQIVNSSGKAAIRACNILGSHHDDEMRLLLKHEKALGEKFWNAFDIFLSVDLNTITQRLEPLTYESIDLGNWQRVHYKDLVRQKISWPKLSDPNFDFFTAPTNRKLMFAEAMGVHVGDRPKRKLEQHTARLENEMRFALWTKNNQKFNDLSKELAARVEYAASGVADFEISQAVFETLIEPTLIQPTFVTHLPKELVPLAKISPEDSSCVEVFECCINGQEIAPGYTEQNDPIEQRERLEHQAGGEQQKLDEDFLIALEHGMPPAGGIGIGIDRLCMMLLGQESIRDVILFPQLKPK